MPVQFLGTVCDLSLVITRYVSLKGQICEIAIFTFTEIKTNSLRI